MTSVSPTTRRLLRLGGLLVVAALSVLALRRLSLTRVVAELATARPGWIVLALLVFVGILPLWAVQWRVLAPDPRPAMRTMLAVVAMTSTVLNTAPLLVGEAAGVYFLVAETGLGRSAALSVLAMDQLFVGVAKLFVLAAAAASVTLPPWMARGAAVLAAGVAILVVVIAAAAWNAARFAMSRVGRALPARLTRAIVAGGAGLAPVRSPRRAGSALGLALAKKAVEVVAILCLQRAFGVDVAPQSAIVVLAAINLATLLPVVPGNLGVYEAAVVLAYTAFGVAPERALGIALVQHACYFAALALPGYRWLARRAEAGRSPATS